MKKTLGNSLDLDLLNSKYLSAEPFPHIIIDGMFDDSILKNIIKEMKVHSQWSGEKKTLTCKVKRWCDDIDVMGISTKEFLNYLRSPSFLKFLEKVSGIQNLIPDPYHQGGGYHEIGKGGFLKIHSDFNYSSKLMLHRRINLLIYLNESWDDAWGGHLELWTEDMKNCVQKISPIFNRSVIFSTSDKSYHGHPDPLTCPDNIKRMSIALYYYTSARPEYEIKRGLSTITDYKPRENEKFS